MTLRLFSAGFLAFSILDFTRSRRALYQAIISLLLFPLMVSHTLNAIGLTLILARRERAGLSRLPSY